VITNLILELVSTVIGAVDALMPHIEFPGWLTSGDLIPSGVIDFFGAIFSTIAPFFPSLILLEILVAIMSLWPAVCAYTVFQWIYRHIPTVAGFGLGEG